MVNVAGMNEPELERLLKALANRRRLAIVNHLRKRKEACVSDIADAIRLSFTSTSKHLKILESAGFLEREQRSTEMYYSVSKGSSPILKHVFVLLRT